ncbi:hypothetical protein DASC09_041270 [Saccharomycopsis crataegensis]|uniref:Transmembrane protein n=1 Tax=Saccharomycopsis crataegensis TaxID=43959 RepID=A0AAV5QQP7_9ASCO|nr:hypothetical protein DASC09_041270 [Saccharomycopsis crataegensis]
MSGQKGPASTKLRPGGAMPRPASSIYTTRTDAANSRSTNCLTSKHKSKRNPNTMSFISQVQNSQRSSLYNQASSRQQQQQSLFQSSPDAPPLPKFPHISQKPTDISQKIESFKSIARTASDKIYNGDRIIVHDVEDTMSEINLEKIQDCSNTSIELGGKTTPMSSFSDFTISDTMTTQEKDWLQSLSVANFFQNIRSTPIFIIYLCKSIIFNLLAFILVIYLNTYNLKYGLSFIKIFTKEELIFTTASLCYEHAFLIIVSLIPITTNSHFFGLCVLIINTILNFMELLYFGNQANRMFMEGKIQNMVGELSSLTISPNEVLSASVQKSREDTLESMLYVKPVLIYYVILCTLGISLLSEWLLYYFWLNSTKISKLNGKNMFQHSTTLEIFKSAQKIYLEKAAEFLNTSCSPPILLVNLVFNKHNEAFFYLSILGLVFVVFQQSFSFLANDMLREKFQFLPLAKIFMLIFNCFLMIQSLSRMMVSSNQTACAIGSFAISPIYFASAIYIFHCIGSIKNSTELYDQIDLKQLTTYIKWYKNRLVCFSLGFIFVFNVIHIGIYAKFQLNYQWFIVLCCLNMFLLPILIVSLDIDASNFNNYVAIVILMFMQFVFLIFDYVSIFFNLNSSNAAILSEIGQSMALIIYTFSFVVLCYLFLKLKKCHTMFHEFLSRYPASTHGGDSSDNASIDITFCESSNHSKWRSNIRLLSRVFVPWVYVRGYMTITFMCLIINYNINNVKFYAANCTHIQELPLIIMIACFVLILTSRLITKTYLDPKPNNRFVGVTVAAVVLFISVGILAMVMYLMISKILLLKTFTYGSKNAELRFQIGIAMLANLAALGEVVLEAMILYTVSTKEQNITSMTESVDGLYNQ